MKPQGLEIMRTGTTPQGRPFLLPWPQLGGVPEVLRPVTYRPAQEYTNPGTHEKIINPLGGCIYIYKYIYIPPHGER